MPRKLDSDFGEPMIRCTATRRGVIFDGYNDRYSFLPLYVFCGQQLLVRDLRPASQDGARHAWDSGLVGEAAPPGLARR